MQTKTLKDLIEINTIKDLENNKIIDYLKETLSKLNFQFKEIGNKKKVLIATRGNSNIGFICHTDTVDKSSMWSKNPLTLTKEENKLYGLGTSDMKGGIAALLEALKNLPLDYPCTCYFTYDEELNFGGIKTLIKNETTFPKVLIFPEPTNNVPIIANKGCLEFEMTVFGKSAHSSTPDLGDNAILKTIKIIQELEIFQKKLNQETDETYTIPYTTMNIATIKGGTTINKVPDTCLLKFDFRTISKSQETKIFNKLTSLSKKYNIKIKELNNVSSSKNNNNLFIKEIEKITNQKVSGLNYLTEASFFKDKDILILGPGPITAHQKDEYIEEKSYLETIELFKKIIKKYKD